MTRIGGVFAVPGRKALIGYLTVGYPTVDATLEIVPALVEGGCDMVELGVPFSDPLADGTTIQRASHRALEQGVTPALCLEVAAKLRRTIDAPLLFMSYFNPLLRYGLEAFCATASQAGVDGLIVPDLPPEEGLDLERLTQRHEIDLVYLVTPTSTIERVRAIAARSRGFIYAVSLKGTTGAREGLPAEAEAFLASVRAVATQPICVGFGIATPEQAAHIAQAADGVIIGSRIIEIVETAAQPARAAQAFARQVKQAISPR